jgi:Phosphotransferase enzyme family
MSNSDLSNTSPEISSADLIPVVRRMTGDAAAEVVPGWRVERIGKDSAGRGTLGIYRVSGRAVTTAGHDTWSVVMKIVDEKMGVGSTSRFNSPTTEIAAYHSGLFDKNHFKSGGLRATKCYGIDARPDGATWLWLEDVSGAPVPPWPDELYVSAAWHVGQFSGYWATRKVPQTAWLDDRQFNGRVLEHANHGAFQRLQAAANKPLAKLACPPDFLPHVLRMEQDTRMVMEAIESLPKTVCHGDSHGGNLLPVFRQGKHVETLAVDWAAVGIGPVGGDAGFLLDTGVIWAETDATTVERLAPNVFASYISGLEDAGWTGDPDHVRLGYLASSAAMEGSRIAGACAGFATDERIRQYFRQRVPHPPDEVRMKIYGDNLRLFRSMLDEAVAIARRV